MPIEEIKKRLLYLEKFYNEWKALPSLDVTPLYEEVKELKRFQDITHEQYKIVMNKKHPHKCPVCEGHITILTEAAKVAFDELLRANLPRTKICVACKGTGIVWG